MKMIDKVFEELQKQGFLPQRENFGIAFKYQMLNYLYLEDKDDEDYFSLYAPYIYEVDEDNVADVLATINTINNAMKVVKLVVNDNHVWACYESKIPKEVNLEDIVPYTIVTLFQSRHQFYKQLKNV